MNREYLEKACEEVDASVFSSDMLFDDSDRVALREYAERWLRAIAEHERLAAEDIVKSERYEEEKEDYQPRGIETTGNAAAGIAALHPGGHDSRNQGQGWI